MCNQHLKIKKKKECKEKKPKEFLKFLKVTLCKVFKNFTALLNEKAQKTIFYVFQ